MKNVHDALTHFPAPWTIGESETRIPIKSGRRTVAYVQLAPGDGDVANLVAAAPDLLEALHGLLDSCIGQYACGRAGAAARAAIAKAEGVAQ